MRRLLGNTLAVNTIIDFIQMNNHRLSLLAPPFFFAFKDFSLFFFSSNISQLSFL